MRPSGRGDVPRPRQTGVSAPCWGGGLHISARDRQVHRGRPWPRRPVWSPAGSSLVCYARLQRQAAKELYTSDLGEDKKQV